MKLGKGLLLLVGGAFLTLLATTSSAASWEQKSFTGGLRTVHVYVPDTKSPIGEGRSLFVVLRGCLQPASAFKTANLDDVADEYGMVIAAADPNTSAGADCWGYWSGMRSRTSGDYKNVIATTEAMINDAKYDIDPNQVYIGGLSSGGAFAMTVGCLAPDIYAGMALDAAPSAGTGMGGAFSHEGTPESIQRNCEGYAGSYKSDFETQITTTAYGTTDGTVPKTYGLQNAKAMALIYGVEQTSEQNEVQGKNNVIESTWENGRVSMVEFGGVGHAWPGGSGASGSYIDGRSANYGLYMAEFFTANNMRVAEPVETCKNVTLDDYSYNPETKIFTATGTATENCEAAMVYINVADSADFQAPANDEYSFTIQNVTCPDEIKVTLENASRETFTVTDMYAGSCGETKIPPVIESFNAITTKGAVSLSGLASDEDGTVVSATITIEQTEYDVEVAENGVFTLTVEGLAAREYSAFVTVIDDDALTADANTTFTIEESEKLAPVLTLEPIEIYKDYAIQCATAIDPDGEITIAVYSIDGNDKQVNNMNPDGSFCVHMPDLPNGDHELRIVVVDNDRLGAEKTVYFTTSDEELQPPVVTIDSIDVNEQMVTIAGTATDADGDIVNVVIEINDTNYPVVLNGDKFTLTLTDLDAGEYQVVVTASDNDMQVTSDSSSFEIEETVKLPPTVTVNADVDGTSVTISGSATDADGEVVKVVVSVNGTDYNVASGQYSKTLTGLEAGEYEVVVTATDADDLTATAITSFTIEEEEEEEETENPWTAWWDWWSSFWTF